MAELLQRYVRLTGLADGSAIRTAMFEGAQHLVVPVVALVGDSVVRPMHSDGPELVPAEELAVAPGGWNGRPVVPDHPNGGRSSANEPSVLESQAFGRLFHTRFEENRLRTEAWLDPGRALRVGPDAVKVIERCQAGETVEVSVGAFVTLLNVEGFQDGKRYTARWSDIVPDHLAMLPEGAEGACNADMGCGAPRVNRSDDGRRAVLRAAVMSRARRPTFSGTESSAWSSPGFADYVRALYDGDEPPSSVSDAPAPLKRAIAARTLLGDPNADNLRDLAFFPVVNPATDRLNERALRAVLGGRGAQADIPEAARESARAMARRLLNSEFDAGLEAAESSRTEGGAMTLQARLAQRLSPLLDLFRVAQDDGRSDNDLREALWTRLNDEVPAFEGIVEVYPETGVVVYATMPDEGVVFHRREFSHGEDGVALADESEEVHPVTRYEPIAAQADGGEEPVAERADCPCGDSLSTAQAKEVTMSDNRKELVRGLISSELTPFTDADAEVLAQFDEERLAAFVEHCSAVATAEPQPEPEPSKLSEDEWLEAAPEALRSLVRKYQAEEQERRAGLIDSLVASQKAWSRDELLAMGTDALQKTAELVKARDYSSRPQAMAEDIGRFEPPDPYRLNERKEAN